MTCRACECETEQVLTLGPQVPANRFLAKADFDKPEPRYDLTVMLCEGCGLAQLRTLVPAADLYSRYLFRTSHATPLRNHFQKLASTYGGKGKSVVEVGSNDGALGAYFMRTGAQYTGVDPAANLAAIANAEGIRTVVGFFGAGAEDACPKADVVVARNVFAHVPDQVAFVKAVDKILNPGGVLLIEAPWVLAMFEEDDAIQIYHEHQVYLGITPLRMMLKPLGFRIAEATEVDLYGGSLLYAIERGTAVPTMETILLEAAEWKARCYSEDGWRAFFARADAKMDAFKRKLEKKKGRVVGYCASAKGSVLLQWANITPDLLPFVADTTAIKVGLFMPGARVPIVSPVALKTFEGDTLAVLSANWLDAIREDPMLRRFTMIAPDGRSA